MLAEKAQQSIKVRILFFIFVCFKYLLLVLRAQRYDELLNFPNKESKKILTEVSEVKMGVNVEVNSLRSRELKRTIPNMPATSKAIVLPALLA
jgi:hypothetical protein